MLHAVTPCFASPALSTPRREVWLKMDCCQPAGSFKIRGIGRLCGELAEAGTEGIVCASGGNAGYAAAWSARALGLRCRIVLPHSSPGHLEARLEALGAQVERHGSHWQQAHAYAVGQAHASGEGYVHPFDHPTIWAGHATVIEEALEAFRTAHPERSFPSDILVAVGGGGLLGGVLHGIRHAWAEAHARVQNGHGAQSTAGAMATAQASPEGQAFSKGLQKPRIWAVETTGAASMHAALQAGRPVALERIDSTAHSLGALEVAHGVFEQALEYGVQSLLVCDAHAEGAAQHFALQHRHGIERASGTVLAALDMPPLADSSHPLCIVCGGLDAVWPQPVGTPAG